MPSERLSLTSFFSRLRLVYVALDKRVGPLFLSLFERFDLCVQLAVQDLELGWMVSNL